MIFSTVSSDSVCPHTAIGTKSKTRIFFIATYFFEMQNKKWNCDRTMNLISGANKKAPTRQGPLFWVYNLSKFLFQLLHFCNGFFLTTNDCQLVHIKCLFIGIFLFLWSEMRTSSRFFKNFPLCKIELRLVNF